MEYLGLTVALAAIAQIASMFFWLPLIKRDKALPESEGGVVMGIVAGLCFVLTAVEGLAVLAAGLLQPELRVVLFGLTIQPVALVGLWVLSARPRLCWPGCLCLLGMHGGALWLASLMTPSRGIDDFGALFAVIFKTIALVPALGSVVALPLARWVLLRAERRGTGQGGAWRTT